MAITQAVCVSFKSELAQGIHDLDTDVLKLALYTDAATLDSTTTVYSATNEVSDASYTAGGETLANVSISTDSGKAIIDFDDVTWSTANFTARGCLIYNSSKANRAIAVFDFGENKTSSGGDFVVQVPTADAASAVLRVN